MRRLGYFLHELTKVWEIDLKTVMPTDISPHLTYRSEPNIHCTVIYSCSPHIYNPFNHIYSLRAFLLSKKIKAIPYRKLIWSETDFLLVLDLWHQNPLYKCIHYITLHYITAQQQCTLSSITWLYNYLSQFPLFQNLEMSRDG